MIRPQELLFHRERSHTDIHASRSLIAPEGPANNFLIDLPSALENH